MCKQSDFNPRSPHGERPAFCAILPAMKPISIHAPRTGSDGIQRPTAPTTAAFQSTLPARGATLSQHLTYDFDADFNPRSPHGERQHQHQHQHPPQAISIHAPRTGSDGAQKKDRHYRKNFNPRSPHGERPPCSFCARRSSEFQPTLPARGATAAESWYGDEVTISTHAPRTGSDRRTSKCLHSAGLISTHAPRTGSDRAGH